ncbi:hypothetical protein ACFQ0M_49685 [Kitasatospora aburaviensis]
MLGYPVLADLWNCGDHHQREAAALPGSATLDEVRRRVSRVARGDTERLWSIH